MFWIFKIFLCPLVSMLTHTLTEVVITKVVRLGSDPANCAIKTLLYTPMYKQNNQKNLENTLNKDVFLKIFF